MGQKVLVIGFLLVFCLLFTAQTRRSNDTSNPGGISSLPPELLRPRYGEEPRFPQDYVIGALGRGDASEESYRYARQIAAGLASGNGRTEGVEFSEQKRLSVLRTIAGLGTRSWRVGGGRVEPDGSVSYLIRFLGRENSVTGELYLRREEFNPVSEPELEPEKEGNGFFWRVDDILLESPRKLSEGKYSPGGADMSAYERFF